MGAGRSTPSQAATGGRRARGGAGPVRRRSAGRQRRRHADQVPGRTVGVLLPRRLVLPRARIRDRVQLTYVTPLDGAFTKPVAAGQLGGMLADRGIDSEGSSPTPAPASTRARP